MAFIRSRNDFDMGVADSIVTLALAAREVRVHSVMVASQLNVLAASGAAVALGTDWPCASPPNPFVNIQEADRRNTSSKRCCPAALITQSVGAGPDCLTKVYPATHSFGTHITG
jgi:hypothetical protein